MNGAFNLVRAELPCSERMEHYGYSHCTTSSGVVQWVHQGKARAWHGKARLGKARRGKARQGFQGLAWQGLVGPGKARQGMDFMAWLGMAGPGKARQGFQG